MHAIFLSKKSTRKLPAFCADNLRDELGHSRAGDAEFHRDFHVEDLQIFLLNAGKKLLAVFRAHGHGHFHGLLAHIKKACAVIFAVAPVTALRRGKGRALNANGLCFLEQPFRNAHVPMRAPLLRIKCQSVAVHGLLLTKEGFEKRNRAKAHEKTDQRAADVQGYGPGGHAYALFLQQGADLRREGGKGGEAAQKTGDDKQPPLGGQAGQRVEHAQRKPDAEPADEIGCHRAKGDSRKNGIEQH